MIHEDVLFTGCSTGEDPEGKTGTESYTTNDSILAVVIFFLGGWYYI